jgi:hypothetical protein
MTSDSTMILRKIVLREPHSCVSPVLVSNINKAVYWFLFPENNSNPFECRSGYLIMCRGYWAVTYIDRF